MHLVHNVTVLGTEHSWILFGEKIEALGSGEAWKVHASTAVVIDGQGGFISRPFIDTHTHGLAGFAVEQGLAAMREIRKHQRRFGVGRSILSLVTLDQQRLLELIADAKTLAAEDPGFLGLHLEGPYISLDRCGAHDTSAIRKPTAAEIAELISAGKTSNGNIIASMTVAPEEFAEEELELLADSGIKLCLGHSQASYEKAKAFFGNFGNVLTHAFNAMQPIQHRAPGPIPAALDAGAFTELIADGHHVLAPAARILKTERVILVTDSMSAAAMADGAYQLGSLNIEVSGGVARTESGALAGSTLTMDQAVANYASWILDPELAIEAATTVPAKAYDIELEGIAEGSSADLLLLDSHAALVRLF